MFLDSLFKLRPRRRQYAVPGSSRNQAPDLPPRRSPWFSGVILLICVSAVAWTLFSQRYYAWALGNERINLVVFCDTADLNDPGLQAVVLYDQLALNPLTRALGLCQNRPPERVKVFFPLPIRKYAVTPVSITLQDVPWGPICRIFFIAHGRHFRVTVPDRRLINGALYVRVPP
ncbi:MAG: hypothetical protein PHW60_06150 [Kiritimatiellae bacterium]|nr:hypothetical protein [Kiritimatiellia bacterium]